MRYRKLKNQKLKGQNEHMTYEFKVNDKGNVSFLMATGNDLVKNSMTLEHAKNTANAGEVTESQIEGYPICVDNKWYFEGIING
nr:MAG TPA: hypothetical protein [Caudoviricetes sp.]